jgi:hypothetical protein
VPEGLREAHRSSLTSDGVFNRVLCECLKGNAPYPTVRGAAAGSNKRRVSNSFWNELNVGTISVPLVGCSGC